MATTQQLTFSDMGGTWTATYTSDGDAVIQLSRRSTGSLTAYAWLDGMPPVAIRTWPGWAAQAMLIRLAVPAGINVRIDSSSPVTEARRLTVAQSGGGGGGDTGGITVDQQLDASSTNPVANAAVTTAIIETASWNEAGDNGKEAGHGQD